MISSQQTCDYTFQIDLKSSWKITPWERSATILVCLTKKIGNSLCNCCRQETSNSLRPPKQKQKEGYPSLPHRKKHWHQGRKTPYRQQHPVPESSGRELGNKSDWEKEFGMKGNMRSGTQDHLTITNLEQGIQWRLGDSDPIYHEIVDNDCPWPCLTGRPRKKLLLLSWLPNTLFLCKQIQNILINLDICTWEMYIIKFIKRITRWGQIPYSLLSAFKSSNQENSLSAKARRTSSWQKIPQSFTQPIGFLTCQQGNKLWMNFKKNYQKVE